MNYEKAYKEALERAKYLKENTDSVGAKDISYTFEYIFPEFKESEDEKIRKALIKSFEIHDLKALIIPGFSAKDVIAWLEKQNTKLHEYINEERNKKDFYCEGKEMSWNEMPLDVRKHDYPYYFKGDLDCFPFNVGNQDEQKEINTNWEDKIKGLNKLEEYILSLSPNRSLDAVKVDAKNIRFLVNEEQKSAWSEEDKERIEFLIAMCDDEQAECVNNSTMYRECTETKDWLKSIKNRVIPQPKQEWNEEDELNLNSFLHKLEVCDLLSNKEITWIKNKLKSIKPNHWKPSEKQMEELARITRGNSYPHLSSLYNELKKL